MSISEEMVLVEKTIAKEIATIDKLPKDKAKEYAHKMLVDIGVITDDGEYTDPYKVLEE